ncbi:MAG TPA: tRNA (adenosine(37)-N6)-threonylcarbamoyltransferase complex ATPase subunit type 1 TsaE [Firmicutes bacterium]|nr:tRNA (adenosine(37)-N6)-threonylcarbamoyltransferase complex ATPase subunit type 1 TsaE [Bacillota bacterium]
MKRVIVTREEKETENLGRFWGEQLFPGAVILLSGGLGAGKTVFARGVGLGLGVRTPITSPTFTLLHVHQGRLPFYHFDLYRLDAADELFELGMEEYLFGEGVCLLEWADKFPGFFDLPAVTVSLRQEGPAVRRITFSSDDARHQEIIRALNPGG